MPLVFGDRSRLTPEIHRQYLNPFESAKERSGPWILARELAGSAEWYESLWDRRAMLASKPSLLLWGMKDPTFGTDALARWREALPGAELEEFSEAGHFVQEEVSLALVPRIASFARRSAYYRARRAGGQARQRTMASQEFTRMILTIV